MNGQHLTLHCYLPDSHVADIIIKKLQNKMMSEFSIEIGLVISIETSHNNFLKESGSPFAVSAMPKP